jgi:leucyl aminopeptidase
MKLVSLKVDVSTSINDMNADGMLFVIPVEGDEGVKLDAILGKLPAWLKSDFSSVARKRGFEPKQGASLSFDAPDGTRKTLLCVDAKAGVFECLAAARKVLDAAAFDVKVERLAVDLAHAGAGAEGWADAFVSAAAARLYKFPKYKTESNDKTVAKDKKPKGDADSSLAIGIVVQKAKADSVKAVVDRALRATSSGTNLVRWLGKRAGNDLTCKNYVEYLKDFAKAQKWSFKHHDHDGLTKMKAGAFLAVVKGSSHKDYGIIELTYTPKVKTSKHLALVGKGIVFDTGGHSLKASAYMLGMHGDMAGSAVALGVLDIASQELWPVKVTAYLAVADNMIGPLAYKPNDVIVSMKGTTIEIIDTDAEGRMVLADALHLAAQEKPTLMMDFATLTGSCVRAIGSTYSGVYTNREDLHGDLIKAGKLSGERVWPFPMDKDFAVCLESTSADFKQCREKGGVDHIEAAQFLMHFAGDKSPWVHVDLSAAEHAGGLAHVASDETGFGVRFATTFARNFLGL